MKQEGSKKQTKIKQKGGTFKNETRRKQERSKKKARSNQES